ncbi:MAG: GAF domain-containing protein [Nitriliruptoraceae bacterium]|jgi:GAF domain-containing protein
MMTRVPPDPAGDIRLGGEDRVGALHETGLLDAPVDPAFERHVRLTRRLLDVPVALVTLVTPRRQWFVATGGLAPPWALARQTPLHDSLCQHVVLDDAPVGIVDARTDTRFGAAGAVRELGVIAYLGVPLRSPEGVPLGALCAIDSEPRVWTTQDIEALNDLAASVSGEIALRIVAARFRGMQADTVHRLASPITALDLSLSEIAGRPEVDPSVHVDIAAAALIARDLANRLSSLVVPVGSFQFGHEQIVDLADVLREAATRGAGAAASVRRTITVASDSVRVKTDAAALGRAVDALVQVMFDQAVGLIVLEVEEASRWVRVRVSASGPSLSTADVAALMERADHEGPFTGQSVATDVQRRLGGRLVAPLASVPVLEIVLPRQH